MTEHRFETHSPVKLYVEIGKGNVHVFATETTESTVQVTGRDADQVHVEQTGDQISVVAPRQRTGFLTGDSSLRVDVVVPLDSDVAIKTGSADVQLEGAAGSAQIRSGSGDVRVDALGGQAVIETGSGDIQLDDARAELRVKSGSGDVKVGHAASAVSVSTGSGDVEIGSTNGPAVVKTGSGDLRVIDAQTDVSMVTGSGDLVVGTASRGKFTMKGASGDVRIGIPAGVPVWTDISTVSGEIRSSLQGAGEPQAGADHVELRAKTVSGDVILTEV
ncbi:MAG: protein YvlB [Nocardioides sp.]|nr:protein YvlB [Nocardioides sp.]